VILLIDKKVYFIVERKFCIHNGFAAKLKFFLILFLSRKSMEVRQQENSRDSLYKQIVAAIF
jgi:hypothetical protein